jgi:signal transduction histidine kinase
MIQLDLEIVLFMGILLIIGAVSASLWVGRRRSSFNVLPANIGWRVCETLPVGIVVLQPGDTIAFMNMAARRLLNELGGSSPAEIHTTLQRFNESAQTKMPQRSGIIHQPLFLRWWYYFLDDNNSLFVLAEGSDQQKFVRQQAFIGQLVHEIRTPLTAIIGCNPEGCVGLM